MRSPDSTPLWQRFFHESIWGRRGLVKVGSLWLPLATILSLGPVQPPLWVPCAALFAAAACRRIAGTLANDLADRADDQSAGKTRWGQTLSLSTGAVVCGAVLGAGVLALALAHATLASVAAYLAAVALVLGYSVRPVRFKERGVLGPLTFALSCVFLYVVTPWVWLRGGAVCLALMGAAMFLDKWVNLHFHQVVDYEADSRQGRGTYAVRAGIERARRTLAWAAGLASLAMAALLIWLAVELLPVWATLVAGALVLSSGVYARLARRNAHRATVLVRELPWHYLALTYTVFRILPPILFAQLALHEPMLWIVAAATGLVLVGDSWNFIRYRYR